MECAFHQQDNIRCHLIGASIGHGTVHQIPGKWQKRGAPLFGRSFRRPGGAPLLGARPVRGPAPLLGEGGLPPRVPPRAPSRARGLLQNLPYVGIFNVFFF